MTRKVKETCGLGHHYFGFRSWLCTRKASYFIFPLWIIRILVVFRSLLKAWSSRKNSGISKVEGSPQLRYLECVGSLRNAGCFKDLSIICVAQSRALCTEFQKDESGALTQWQGTPMPPCGIHRLHTQEPSSGCNWIWFVSEKTIMVSLLRIRIDFWIWT